MRKRDNQPPYQGVQIAAMISCIRINALCGELNQQERLWAMENNLKQAKMMLDAYYEHFVERTKKLP